MRPFIMLLVLGASACGQEPEPNEVAVAPAPAAEPMAQPTPAQKAMLVPIPDDKAQLARLESMGYTRHDAHLHLPGVKECPMDMAGSPIQ